MTRAIASEPACQSYARVTIIDREGTSGRGCARHAVQALENIDGAHIDWADSKGLNEHERRALEIAADRNRTRTCPS